MVVLYAKAGERVFGTRTVKRGNPQRDVIEDYHVATVRHDIVIGELPDFPACLGDWQQKHPPLQRHFIKTLENVVTTATRTKTHETEGVGFAYSTATETITKTSHVDLHKHGSGKAPQFGVPWSGESWWREYDHGDANGTGSRYSVHYDLRFRGTNGSCVWGMDRLKGTAT